MLVFHRHRWNAETGNSYDFRITLTDNGIPDGGGIYIFVRRRFVFFMKPLYIGKATSFKRRMFKHERWGEAWYKLGATERHFLKISNGAKRSRVEEDLIRNYNPVMNNEHIPRNKKDAPNDRRLKGEWNLPWWLKSWRWFRRWIY